METGQQEIEFTEGEGANHQGSKWGRGRAKLTQNLVIGLLNKLSL